MFSAPPFRSTSRRPKFARLRILDWTLVSRSACVVRWKCPPVAQDGAPTPRAVRVVRLRACRRHMTLEERERFKKAEAAEKQRQQEIRARHGGLLHVENDKPYNTDPYEETPAEEPVDTLVNKPSVGILSVLVRVGLFVLIALGFVVYRSGQPGRVVAIAGRNVPLDLKVAGAYQNLLGGGRDSPGAVAVYLHHDARSAADWSGLAPFADDAPNAVPCGMSQRGV